MPKITNADRFPDAIFLPVSQCQAIGTLNGVALFKIGTDGDEILVSQIGVAMGGSIDRIEECQALELFSLATHCPYSLEIYP